jgi:hypothetical protein
LKATELLANQMEMIHSRVSDLADVSREQWLARPATGGNQVGFTAWHVVATRDWTVRALFQAKPPLGWMAPFAGTGVALCQIPFGMPAIEADAIAQATSPAEVVAYSKAVTDELVRWLGAVDDAALAAPPPAAPDHLSLSPRYNDRAYRRPLQEDPDDMCLWPVWTLLSMPSLIHCTDHLAEIDIARNAT